MARVMLEQRINELVYNKTRHCVSFVKKGKGGVNSSSAEQGLEFVRKVVLSQVVDLFLRWYECKNNALE